MKISSVVVQNKNSFTKEFKFDRVYDVDKNNSMFDDPDVNFMVKRFLNTSINIAIDSTSTIIAYGQTGAGKTYTIDKLVRNVIKKIYETNETKTVTCSFYQIYNEKIYDLLIKTPKAYKNKLTEKDLKIKLMPDGNYGIEDLTEVTWKEYDELMKLYMKSNKNKVVDSHELNQTSSRAHSIFKISLVHKEARNSIMFVDLAGSERFSYVDSSQTKITKEGIEINKSLFTLK